MEMLSKLRVIHLPNPDPIKKIENIGSQMEHTKIRKTNIKIILYGVCMLKDGQKITTKNLKYYFNFVFSRRDNFNKVIK
jgi:hypothetical protein